jgi:hypothetical protein
MEVPALLRFHNFNTRSKFFLASSFLDRDSGKEEHGRDKYMAKWEVATRFPLRVLQRWSQHEPPEFLDS